MGYTLVADPVTGALVPAAAKTSNYTLTLADAGGCVETNQSTALTVTVPPNSSVAFPIGTVIELCRYGTGTLTVTPGAGVTLRTPASLTARAQYSSLSLRLRGVNEWIVGGDLT